MTEEQLEELRKEALKGKHADTLVWYIGLIKTLLERGIDPQYILDDLAVRYKIHKEFGQQLSDGIEFGEKTCINDDYKFMDRILKMPYNHGTD